MTEKVRAVSPSVTLEEAAQILLKFQIGGLPVVDNGRLVGIITTSDVMKAFLDTMGASQPASTRIDFILEGEEHGLTEASRVVSREGGEILGSGPIGKKSARTRSATYVFSPVMPARLPNLCAEPALMY
jgi:hypothetical protein